LEVWRAIDSPAQFTDAFEARVPELDEMLEQRATDQTSVPRHSLLNRFSRTLRGDP
jgi:hypothetical protein